MSNEECDDNNLVDLDGCDKNCKNEKGWNCTLTDNSTCSEICGDGFLLGNENCDDHSNDSNGCNEGCKTGSASGWIC